MEEFCFHAGGMFCEQRCGQHSILPTPLHAVMHTSLVASLQAKMPFLRCYGQHLRREHTPGANMRSSIGLVIAPKIIVENKTTVRVMAMSVERWRSLVLAIWVIIVVNERNWTLLHAFRPPTLHPPEHSSSQV